MTEPNDPPCEWARRLLSSRSCADWPEQRLGPLSETCAGLPSFLTLRTKPLSEWAGDKRTLRSGKPWSSRVTKKSCRHKAPKTAPITSSFGDATSSFDRAFRPRWRPGRQWMAATTFMHSSSFSSTVAHRSWQFGFSRHSRTTCPRAPSPLRG